MEYLGHLPDLDPWFDGLRLTVAPLRFGAGAKGKVVSSLAAGVPCVATSIAVEGMAVADGEEVLVADDPDTISERIVNVYSDPELWTRLSLNGHRMSQKDYSLAEYRRRLHEILVTIGLPCLAPP